MAACVKIVDPAWLLFFVKGACIFEI